MLPASPAGINTWFSASWGLLQPARRSLRTPRYLPEEGFAVTGRDTGSLKGRPIEIEALAGSRERDGPASPRTALPVMALMVNGAGIANMPGGSAGDRVVA